MSSLLLSFEEETLSHHQQGDRVDFRVLVLMIIPQLRDAPPAWAAELIGTYHLSPSCLTHILHGPRISPWYWNIFIHVFWSAWQSRRHQRYNENHISRPDVDKYTPVSVASSSPSLDKHDDDGRVAARGQLEMDTWFWRLLRKLLALESWKNITWHMFVNYDGIWWRIRWSGVEPTCT
jgi:hypothetical protein